MFSVQLTWVPVEQTLHSLVSNILISRLFVGVKWDQSYKLTLQIALKNRLLITCSNPSVSAPKTGDVMKNYQSESLLYNKLLVRR
jgi:hypothetical protein